MYKIFLTIGLIFIIIGVILYLFKGFPLFRLPGDIYIDKGNFKFYFPITSSILLSIGISLLFTFFSKFFK